MANKKRDEAEEDALDAGMEAGWSNKSLDEQREELFDSSGRLKDHYANDATKRQVINNWYERAYRTDRNPAYSEISEDVRTAMRNLEADERFSDGITRFKKHYKYGGSESVTDFDYNDKINNQHAVDEMYNNSNQKTDQSVDKTTSDKESHENKN